jgi:hypothetical protein
VDEINLDRQSFKPRGWQRREWIGNWNSEEDDISKPVTDYEQDARIVRCACDGPRIAQETPPRSSRAP